LSKVIVVTDSTADLPAEIYDELNITTVPLNVHFGDEVCRDQLDLTADEFWAKLAAFKGLPRTSQPSPGDFTETYQRLAAQFGDDASFISIHISQHLSGTLQSARMAAEMLPDLDITVVDSLLASLPQGMVVAAAARAAREGASKEEVLDLVERIKAGTRLYFCVDTLEYLQKNGRIGRAQAFLGALLNVKPLLTLQDGVVTPVEKIRGARRVIPRMAELAYAHVGGAERPYLGIMHAGVPERAAELADLLRERTGVDDVLVGTLGPVIGTHAGPGTLGVCAYVL